VVNNAGGGYNNAYAKIGFGLFSTLNWGGPLKKTYRWDRIAEETRKGGNRQIKGFL
jgi:hypothetical protein